MSKMSALEQGATTVSATALWELRDEASQLRSMPYESRTMLDVAGNGRCVRKITVARRLQTAWAGSFFRLTGTRVHFSVHCAAEVRGRPDSSDASRPRARLRASGGALVYPPPLADAYRILSGHIVRSGPPAAATWRGPTALSGGEKRESGRTFLCPHEIGPSMRFAAPILRRPIRRGSCQRGRRRSSRICIRMTRTPKVADDFLRDTRDRFPWADLVAEPKPLRDVASLLADTSGRSPRYSVAP